MKSASAQTAAQGAGPNGWAVMVTDYRSRAGLEAGPHLIGPYPDISQARAEADRLRALVGTDGVVAFGVVRGAGG